MLRTVSVKLYLSYPAGTVSSPGVLAMRVITERLEENKDQKVSVYRNSIQVAHAYL